MSTQRWDAWSRVIVSFVKEMAEMDGVHQTKGELCRLSVGNKQLSRRDLWFMSNSECVIEELSMRGYNRDGQVKNHMNNCVVGCVEGPEERQRLNSVKAIGPMEVGVTCQEPNVRRV